MQKKEQLHILLVEDNPGDARLVQEMLKESSQDVRVKHVLQLSDLKSLSSEDYDLILLDLNLPDSSGLNTALKAQELLPNVPIIVMTGLDNEELSIAAIQSGAQDYLVKSKSDAQILFKTIQYALSRYKTLKKINEVSDTQKAYFSSHDVVTGLPNQQLFLETLGLMVEKREIMKKSFAIAFLRIHEFDSIVRHFGHSVKDELIKKVSNALSLLFPKSVIISRYNENTFALLYQKIQDTASVSGNIAAIQLALANHFLISDKEYLLSYNIGISIFPFDGQNAEDLIKSAQAALTKSIELGLREYEIFSKNIYYSSKEDEELILYSDLEAALERQEFFIVYQPQVFASDHKVSGVEALLRWRHPKRGMISPEKFIYIAEEAHLIAPIGIWVLETAVKQYQKWQYQTQNYLPLRVSVNVSIQQLQSNTFFSNVQKILNKYEIPPEFLEIELTESIFIDQAELIIEKLNQLKKLGIQIAIDDFGKGYSALSYLSHLPIDHVKLDMAFVEKNLENSPTSTIVKSIINLVHKLNLTVIAEGVETLEQLQLLRKQGCDEIQGYYFSQPVSQNQITHLISQDLQIQPKWGMGMESQ